MWRDDEQNGLGTLYLVDGSTKEGNWKGKTIVNKAAKDKGKYDERNVEKLFEWQPGSVKD